MRLLNVRLAFPVLHEAKTVNGEGKPAFSAAFLMPPDHPQVAEIEAELKRLATEKWGTKGEAMLKELKLNDKLALHDGDRKPRYEGYPGNLYLSSRSQVRPQVLDRDAKTELTPQDGRPYAGCYVNAIVDFWVQDNNYGKRINCTLHKVQFLRDGDAFAGGAMSDEEFDDLGVGEEGSLV